MQSAVWTGDELSGIQNVDRLLPSQPYFSKLYTGNPLDYFQRMQDMILGVQQYKLIESKWDIRGKPEVTYACLGSEISTLYFYQMLIRLGGYKSALELGTFIGVSALFMAEALGDDGSLTTVEIGQEFYDLAKENIQRNGYADQIEQVQGCALQTLRLYAAARKKFDIIFIDAGKESYGEMLPYAAKCLADNGTILVDDVFFQGEIFNETPLSPKAAGVKSLLDKAAMLGGYEKVILPLGNGLLILRKVAS